MCIICKTNHRVTHQPTDDDYDEIEAGEHFYLFIRFVVVVAVVHLSTSLTTWLIYCEQQQQKKNK